MLRYQVLVAVMSLSLVGAVGSALADGPSAGYSGEKVAQISFVDRALNLIQLSMGWSCAHQTRVCWRISRLATG